MSDFAEGLGGAVEGALVSRAVEPGHGKGDGHDNGPCRNCGAEPMGAYCQNCGQKVHVHRTLSAIGHDLIHGVLHLDGKFWATLPLLVFRPGKLTRRYIDGERARFVSPMAMFLFSVFAMFAIFQMVGLTVPTEIRTPDMPQWGEMANKEVARLTEKRAELQGDLEALPSDDPVREEVEAQLRGVEEELTAVQRARTFFAQELGSPEAAGAGSEEIVAGIPVREGKDGAQVVPFTLDGEDNVNIDTSQIPLFDKLIGKWRENPTLMLYKLQANGYKFSWLLIPLSIPFVWLTFAWRRRFHAYDHAIFVTYSLSFMSLLFITVSLVALIPNAWPFVVALILLVPPIHLYKQLRGAYEIGRFSAFWRLMVLSACIWIVLLLFLQVLLMLGAF